MTEWSHPSYHPLRARVQAHVFRHKAMDLLNALDEGVIEPSDTVPLGYRVVAKIDELSHEYEDLEPELYGEALKDLHIAKSIGEEVLRWVPPMGHAKLN